MSKAPPEKSGSYYSLLLSLVSPHRGPAVALCLLAIASAGLEGIGVSLLVPLLQTLEGLSEPTGNRIIDLINSPLQGVERGVRLQVVVGALFVVVLLKNCFTYAHLMTDEWFRIRIMRRLRLDVSSQLLRVGYKYVAERRGGEFVSSFGNDVPRAGSAVRALLTQVAVVATASVYLFFLFLVSWQLTLIALLLLGLISLPLQFVLRRAQAIGQELTSAQSNLSAVTLEMLAGMRLIRVFGREAHEQRRFDRALESVDRRYLQAARLQRLVKPASEILAIAVLCILLLASSKYLLTPQSAMMPVVMTFLFVLFRLLPQATLFNKNRAEIAKHYGAVKAIFEMLSDQGKPYIRSGGTPVAGISAGIRFKDVSFSYCREDGPVIRGLDIHIPARQVTAIVGASGGGKSTIADLIPRFYDPDGGQILVDGIDLRELDLKEWRSKIGYVSQDTFVFASSIRDNIGYGREGASVADIESAARRANAYDFITRLPEGFDTMVGDRGVRLSGGQRQRIAIARAIVSDPELLILDEATSALDTASERLIQESIDTLRVDRTVLVVAHRLSTIVNADQVIVIEDGQAIETGTHEALLSLGGAYSRLHALQFESGSPSMVFADVS